MLANRIGMRTTTLVSAGALLTAVAIIATTRPQVLDALEEVEEPEGLVAEVEPLVP